MDKGKLIEKLHSMRYSKKAVQKETDPERKLSLYGYTECINELLIWANKKQPETWQQIEKDFIKWDNETYSYASQRQILDWFKERFAN